MRQHVRVSLLVLISVLLFGSLSNDPIRAGGIGTVLPQTNNATVNVIFDEDFQSASGTTPPSGWTTRVLAGNTSDVWRFDNGKSRRLVTPILAPAAIVDFDLPGDREIVLESPEFNAQSSHDLILSFDQFFLLADSSAHAKIDVYDGYSWVEIFSTDATLSGVMRETFSIAGVTNCSPHARIRFRWIGSRGGYWIVDNVLLVKRVTTAVPSEVLVVSPNHGSTNVLPRTSLGWTPSAPCPTGYRLFLGTDNPPTNVLNGVDLGSATSYSHPTPLQYNTTYYWKIVPYNLNGNASNVAVKSFTTGGNPTVSSFPYTQNFDGSTYGWTSENSNGDPYTWELTTSNARSNPYATIAYAPPGNAAADDWLLSMPLRMTAGHQYKIDFWTRVANATKREALEVSWGNDQNSQSMSPVPLYRNAAMTNTAYAMSTALVTSPDSTGSSDQYIGWRYVSQPGSEFLLLDDVTITDLGVSPILLSQFTAARSANSIQLLWRVLSQTNNVQFEIQRAVAPSLEYQTLAGSVVSGHGTTSTPHDYSWIDSAPGSTRVYYRIKQTSTGGASYYSNPVSIDGLTSVSTNDGIADQFMLGQNYPNPFNPVTTIGFRLQVSSHVALTVYDMLGREVATLVNEAKPAGEYSVQWDASGLPSGVYFYRLQSVNSHAVRKLTLLK
ncbi:MAG: T9SS type A sorting domain-containing protein [Ignavibacteriae bacterium]|nr:T9SS type A sorting domain-containing protein [Ignavibacteriota bacterium]